jgi:long-chain acyl-CoA synthetase
MLSFGSFGYVGVQVKKYFRLDKPQRFFSYLPLSHIAERALMEMVALSSGSTISFTESLQKFQENLQHEQPTIFGGVPRIFAKFQEGILKKIPQTKLSRLLSIPFVNAVVRNMLLKKLGLSRASIIVCGAAPTPVSLLNWFNELGIDIRETYGMTENTAYSHSNFRLIKNGTVGQAWPEVDVKCDESGEVLIRHQALMKGYYKDPVTTAAVFTEDGFLKTGDQGAIDFQGFLTITGRVKDQFKTDKAKFIAPAPMELKMSSNTDLDQICVVGTGLPQPIALVTLSATGREKTQRTVEAELEKTISEVNSTLEKYEHIHKAVILKDSWTIENGLMTPSMKIKRNGVEKIYEGRYLQWFKHDQAIVWED